MEEADRWGGRGSALWSEGEVGMKERGEEKATAARREGGEKEGEGEERKRRYGVGGEPALRRY